jgi:hypothetical protein
MGLTVSLSGSLMLQQKIAEFRTNLYISMEYKMKQTLMLLILLISAPCFSGEYSDCILENMKGIGTQSAAMLIKQACREKALPYEPAKCKSTFNNIEREVMKEGHLSEVSCIDKCLNASYW